MSRWNVSTVLWSVEDRDERVGQRGRETFEAERIRVVRHGEMRGTLFSLWTHTLVE